MRTPGSPWMPRPTSILPSSTVKSGSVWPGTVQPANPTPAVRTRELAWRVERFDVGDAVAARGGGPGRLEDVEPAGNAAPAVSLFRGCGEHVVRDEHGAGVDAVGAQARFRHAEVHDVAAVVAEGEEHAGAAIDRLGHAIALLAGGRGEDVPDGRAGGETVADQPVEGGVVPGAATNDHADLARRWRAVGNDAAGPGDTAQVAAVGGGVAADHLFPEL